MDVTPPQRHDPASGDDELAKVLAGVSDDPNAPSPSPAAAAGLQFEETPVPGASAPVAPAAASPAPVTPQPETTSVTTMPAPTATPSAANPELEAIKKNALEELRPLVDKLDLPPEDKFDTLLLIIRSTDDQSLVPAAHEAAKGIADESKRAQALLDVIKEIDYFANPQPQQ
jgi:hypothetical protein